MMASVEKDGFVVLYRSEGKIRYLYTNEETERIIGHLLSSAFQNKVNVSRQLVNIENGFIKDFDLKGGKDD